MQAVPVDPLAGPVKSAAKPRPSAPPSKTAREARATVKTIWSSALQSRRRMPRRSRQGDCARRQEGSRQDPPPPAGTVCRQGPGEGRRKARPHKPVADKTPGASQDPRRSRNPVKAASLNDGFRSSPPPTRLPSAGEDRRRHAARPKFRLPAERRTGQGCRSPARRLSPSRPQPRPGTRQDRDYRHHGRSCCRHFAGQDRNGQLPAKAQAVADKMHPLR